MNTPLDYTIVSDTIAQMRLGDFSGATIRDIAMLAGKLEQLTGQPFIHLEMGVPGLKPSQIGIEAEKQALDAGCAAIYPPNAGIDRLKQAASRFIKAFIGIDLKPQGCIATVGSMQATFAVFTALKLANTQTSQTTAPSAKDTILFIHPASPYRPLSVMSSVLSISAWIFTTTAVSS